MMRLEDVGTMVTMITHSVMWGRDAGLCTLTMHAHGESTHTLAAYTVPPVHLHSPLSTLGY